MRRTASPARSLLLGLALGGCTPALAGRTGRTRAWARDPRLHLAGSGCRGSAAWLTWTWRFARAMTGTQFRAAGEHVFMEKGYGRGAVRSDRRELPPGFTLTPRATTRRVDRVRLAGPLLRRHPAAVSHQPRRGGPEGLAPSLRDAGRPDDADGGHVTGLDHGRSDPDRADRRADDGHRRGGLSRKFYPELYRLFHADETVLTPRVMEITGVLLKRASSDLADVLYSIDQGSARQRWPPRSRPA